MALKLGTLFYEFGANTSKLKKAQKEVINTNKKVSSSFSSLGTVIAGVLSIETARRVLMIADGMTRLKGRIDTLTKSQKESSRVFNELVATANELGIELNGVVSAFQRFALVKDIVGASNAQTLQFTENIQKLGIVSGATGQEITSTSIQIGQALANNFEAAAQEINSINEQMPEVARAVERSLKLQAGSFKKAVTSGKVTSEQFFNAILQQTDLINEKFAKLPVTIERATAMLATNFAVALTEADDILGTTQAIAESLQGGAKIIATDFSDVLIHLRTGFIQLFGELDKGMINFQKSTRGFVVNLGLAIQNVLGLQTAGSLKRLAEIENERKAELQGAKDATAGLLAELEKRRIARAAARKKADDERNTPVIARLDNEANKVEGLKGGTGDVENKALDSIVKSMASETQAIELALLDRESKILKLEGITEAKRFELLTQSAAIRNKQIAELEAANQQAAFTAAQNFGNTLNSAMRATGKEGTAIAKTIFLANKAVYVASIIAATQAAAANASVTASVAGPLGYFTTKAGILTSGYASAAAVAGMAVGSVAGGRQSGGRVFPGAMHPINENGDPELLQQGARQFLLPGNKSGNVTALKDGATGGAPKIVINNNAAGVDVDVVSITRDEVQIMINQGNKATENKINAGLARGQGPTSRALRSGFDTQRNLG